MRPFPSHTACLASLVTYTKKVAFPVLLVCLSRINTRKLQVERDIWATGDFLSMHADHTYVASILKERCSFVDLIFVWFYSDCATLF